MAFTDYEQMTQEAKDNGLDVVECNLKRCDGLIVNNVIGIRETIETENRKADVLSEELGHAYLTVGNILDQTNSNNRRQEHVARMWAYDRRVGLNGIVKAYRHGCRTLCECAECLDISEEFLEEALEMYRRKYGCSVEYKGYEISFEPRLQIFKHE